MLKKIVLAFALGLMAIGLASCEDPEEILKSQYRLESRLPPGCKVTYGGEFFTGKHRVPIIIIDCRSARVTTTNGSFSSGKATHDVTSIVLTNE